MSTTALLVLLLVVCAIVTQPELVGRMALNQAAVLTTHALVRDPSGPAMYTASRALTTAEGCSAHWFRGLLAHAASAEDARDEAWVKAMRCSPRYIPMVFAILPDYLPLAEAAAQAQPDSADAWFALARIRSQENPEAAIELYRRGLALRPTDGRRWQELGNLLAGRDPQAAIEAYLQSCHNGDPGSNGCWNAGKTAERLGDIKVAIRYYRLSRWSAALSRAAQLEQQLREQTSP
jgi:tetratricopeptide (TPR) repeat protein